MSKEPKDWMNEHCRKVNSTLWGLMVESGVGRGLIHVSNRVVGKIVKHGGGSIIVRGCMGW